MPEYALKNVKVAEFASDETWCFEASVYRDGKRVGTVSNDGHGGSNMYHPHSLGVELDAHAKTLPPHVHPDFTIEQDADIFVGDLLDDYLIKRDIKKDAKTKVLFLAEGEDERAGWRTVAMRGEHERAAIIAYIDEKYPNARIWNGKEFTNAR